MKVLILGGAGTMAMGGASYLMRYDDVSKIVLTDINMDAVNAVADRLKSPKIETKYLDALDKEALTNEVKNYDVVLSWKPSTLFSMIQLEKPNVTVDETTGAVCVDVLWSQNNTSICIDGSLRAKVYDNNGKCRGCAYLNLPKVGTYHRKGKLSGICMRPEGLKKLKSDKYTVVVEPMNLWELAAKGYGAPIENDKLTAEEHHKIVADSEAEFKKEVA